MSAQQRWVAAATAAVVIVATLVLTGDGSDESGRKLPAGTRTATETPAATPASDSHVIGDADDIYLADTGRSDPRRASSRISTSANPERASSHRAQGRPAVPGELVVFRTPMRLVEGFESGQVAEGTEFVVEATPDGISYEVTATDLTPGNAYTMWLFITNHPEHCVDNPEKDPLAVCGSADVYANSEMTGTSLVRGLGWVACEKRQKCVTTDEATVIKTKENSGTLTMTVSGTYPADEAIEERIEMVGDGILSNPLGAEYQVGGFIDHGPYDNETYENDEQIRRSTGGCAPVPDVEHYCPELFGTGARTQAPIKCIQGIRCFVIDPTSDAWQP